MTEFVFDMGQTGTRARIRDVDSTIELSLPGFSYGDDLGTAIARTVEAAAHATSTTHFDVVSGGCTGLFGVVPELSALARTLHASVGTKRVIIADDAVTSYFGARGTRPGVMAAVGTGLVTFGVGEVASARVDGVGYLLGDDGAGWWVGRRGLIAAFSAIDGRAGGSPALLDALITELGPAESVPMLIAASPSPVATVARFARVVASAAEAGDAVAREIFRGSAAHIGEAIVAAARRSEQLDTFDYTVTGGLAQAGSLIDATLADTVHAAFPHASRVSPIGTSLDGALELVRMPSINRLAPFADEYTNS